MLTEMASFERAELVAQKLLDVVRQPFILDGHAVHISCSIGAVVYPDHSDNQHTLLRMADDALSAAKRLRNTMRRYTDDMARPSATTPLVFSTVRRAIDLEELEVYYQPQADVRTGALCRPRGACAVERPVTGIRVNQRVDSACRRCRRDFRDHQLRVRNGDETVPLLAASPTRRTAFGSPSTSPASKSETECCQRCCASTCAMRVSRCRCSNWS